MQPFADRDDAGCHKKLQREFSPFIAWFLLWRWKANVEFLMLPS